MRPDKIIYHNEKIKKGHIDTTSICFHSNHKNKSEWNDKIAGDFNFIKNSQQTLILHLTDYLLFLVKHSIIIKLQVMEL